MGNGPINFDQLFSDEGDQPIKVARNGEMFSTGEVPDGVSVSTLNNDLGGEFCG